MGALNMLDAVELEGYIALGELSLDAKLSRVNGILPASLLASQTNRSLICPHESGPEAAWAGDVKILAPKDLLSLMNHFKGYTTLAAPQARLAQKTTTPIDMADVKGQEFSKRALEIAAAGGHHILMIGPPGVGKSMLAERMPTILPPLTPKEALDVTIVHSLAGMLPESGLVYDRPYRDPHHSASLVALVGGGVKSKPGELSLSHHGVLFLDELPEFPRGALEALRQPLETGRITIARANHHVTYPARIQLIAAMNPCRCGFYFDLSRQCSRVPNCARDYQSKISGPLMDRFDLVVTVDDIKPSELFHIQPGECSETILNRIVFVRKLQHLRYNKEILNAFVEGKEFREATVLEKSAEDLLTQAFEIFKLSMRGYTRTLRVARTISDLEFVIDMQKDFLNQKDFLTFDSFFENVFFNKKSILQKHHVAEALSYRHH
jgi:magnesium chelatase family protein